LSGVYGLGEYGGVLYGASAGLFQLNPSTGAVTSAPTTFSQNGNSFGALNGFGSTNAGLFAVGAGSGNLLYSVNPSTGTPTLIGPTGVIAGGGTGFLSASTDSGELYWEVQNGCTDTLYSVNTSTGSATLIGTAAACSPSKTGNPYSLVFTGGTLWANFYSAGFGTISTSSGAQTLVSTNASPYFTGLAPYPIAPPAWATGFGPTSPAAPDGVAVPSTATYDTLAVPTVTIDNISAIVYGAALAPGSVGLYQIAIQVPATLANGTWPIQATIGGVSSPSGTVLTVHQ
jgi:hypothetical protein